MIEFDVLFDKLAQFQTSEELADYFRDEGIQGDIGDTKTCVISNWFSSHGAEVKTNVAVIRQITSMETKEVTPAMKRFIRDFDLIKYPELAYEESITQAMTAAHENAILIDACRLDHIIGVVK